MNSYTPKVRSPLPVTLLILGTALFVFGSSFYIYTTLAAMSEKRPAAVSSEPSSQNATVSAEPILFEGRTWEFVGPVSDWGDASFTGLPTATEWRCADSPSRRLLVVTSNNSKDGPQSSMWTTILCQQNLVLGKWIHDGLSRTTYHDGRVIESHHKARELHGPSRVWAANGQLIKEETYRHGKREGLGRGWSADGKPQWEATYANDVEVSGKTWDENGVVHN